MATMGQPANNTPWWCGTSVPQANQKGRDIMAKSTKATEQGEAELQGEGDYRSAKRFNDRSEAFVRSHGAGLVPSPVKNPADSETELRKAEEAGKARSRGQGQDARDAQHMEELEDEELDAGALDDAELDDGDDDGRDTDRG